MYLAILQAAVREHDNIMRSMKEHVARRGSLITKAIFNIGWFALKLEMRISLINMYALPFLLTLSLVSTTFALVYHTRTLWRSLGRKDWLNGNPDIPGIKFWVPFTVQSPSVGIYPTWSPCRCARPTSTGRCILCEISREP